MGEDDDFQNETQIDDVAADIRAAVDQSSGRALAEKVATAEVEIPQETETQKAERLRNERGQFVAKDTAEAQKPATGSPITDADPAQANVAVPSNAPDMPKTWSAEAKTEWSKLPPAVQQAVLKREAEIDNGGRQWSSEKRAYEQAFQPVQALSQQYGLPGAEVINRLVTAEQRLQKDPVTAITELAQAYGVDLAALVNGSPQPQRQVQQPSFDPNIIPQLIDQRLNAWQQDQALNVQIQSFANARDAAGNVAHPHFANESVKQHMSALLDKGLATDLQDAYDKAVWALPDIRTSLMAPKPQAIVVDQGSKAKKAMVSPRGAPSGSVPAKPNGYDPKASIEDDIRESIAAHRH